MSFTIKSFLDTVDEEPYTGDVIKTQEMDNKTNNVE